MLLKKSNDSSEIIHYKGVGDVLFRLKNHYISCINLIGNRSNGNLFRAASRFMKIEHSMIDEIIRTFNIKETNINSTPMIEEARPVILNYNDMYTSNLNLITFLKNTIKTFNNQHMSSFLSYWVAALQVENDEIAKHL